MRGYESQVFSNVAATTAAFLLNGGQYGVDVVATFGGGSVKLQKLGADGSTWVDMLQTFEKADGTGTTPIDQIIGSFGAAGYKAFFLPPGNYRFAITTASAVYIALARIPGE